MKQMNITKKENLNDPYIVAGNRMYSIANQNGEFPRIGWHVEGEMAGVWAHPIKLFNEYHLNIFCGDKKLNLESQSFNITPIETSTNFNSDLVSVVKSEFVPDNLQGMVVEYKVRNNTNEDLNIKVLFNAVPNIIGTWTCSDAGFQYGKDQVFFNNGLNKIIFTDEINPWFAGLYALEEGKIALGEASELYNVNFEYNVKLSENEEKKYTFILAGSNIGSNDIENTIKVISGSIDVLKEEKATRYEDLKKLSDITIDNKEVKESYDWMKFNHDMIIREIPSLGRGYGAGFPHFPWWFGTDACYTVPAGLVMGQHDVCKDTLRLIKEISERENGDGRIVHETSTFDVTYNKGNTQETPHFVKSVNQVFQWTGDIEFVKEMYDYCKNGVFNWLLGEMDSDGDLLADGYGIIEIYCLNLEMIDTAVLTYEALVGLENMAKVLGDTEVINKCQELIPRIREEIEKKFWMEDEGLYADMSGTIEDMRERAPELINNEKMDSYKKREMEHYFNLERSTDTTVDLPWLMKNWIIVTPLEAKLTDKARAEKIFSRLESEEFTNEYGFQLSGVKKDYEIEENQTSSDMYSLDLAMSISSGVMAYAEAQYNRANESFEYTKKLSKLLYTGMPGAISETLPDKGCFLQAWSSFGINWTLISGIMGIKPDAFNKVINIEPSLPDEINELKIENLLIGNDSFKIELTRKDNEIVVSIEETYGWTVNVIK